MKVSVIVPVYNVEAYLSRCVSSILKQSYKGFELILVDDGSTDDGGDLCDALAKTDSRIKVIHQDNQGLSAARNTGLAHAHGDYVTFVDSDDFVSKDYLDLLVGMVMTYKLDIAVGHYQVFSRQHDLKQVNLDPACRVVSGYDAAKAIIKDSNVQMIVSWGKLYKRSLFDHIKFPLNRWHEDEFVTYKVLLSGHRVGVTKSPVYFYYQRPQSITGQGYSVKRLDKLKALKEAIEWLKASDYPYLVPFAIYRYMLNLQIASYKIRYESPDLSQALTDLSMAYKAIYHGDFQTFKSQISPVRRGLVWTFKACPVITLRLVHVLRKVKFIHE